MKTEFVSLLILVIMVNACASSGVQNVSLKDNGTSEAVMGVVDVPEDKPMQTLAFTDLSMFDKELSRAMKADQEEIEVAMISPFTINDIPDRLGKWIFMVDKHDGEVEVKSTDPTKRSLTAIGLGIGFVASAVGAIRDKIMYRPSRQYDAVILYQPEEGVVEKIIFRRKSE